MEMARTSFTDDTIALNQLAYRYATAVDACDAGLFLKVFHPQARLRSYHPDSETAFADLNGHADLATIPETMRGMFRRTAHMMTNHLVNVDGDEATGEVLCTARHLPLDASDATSINVIIRYIDRYIRHEGNWLILDRQIRFLWSEHHTTSDSGMGR